MLRPSSHGTRCQDEQLWVTIKSFISASFRTSSIDLSPSSSPFSACSPAVVPQGGYNWTYLDCSYEGEGLQKICRSSACEDSSCIIVNKYNPNSCQGGGGKFQRAFCLRADGGNVSNVGQWPEISPAQCNSTVYTQKPGHQPPWTDPKKSAAGAVSAGSLKTAAIAVAVALATILL